MLREIVEQLIIEGDSKIVKKLKTMLQKNGHIEITYGGTDTWASIDTIEDGYGYGLDQFDKDIEIDLDNDDYLLV